MATEAPTTPKTALLRPKSLLIAALAAVVLLAGLQGRNAQPVQGAAVAPATTLTLYASQDAWISELDVTANHGADTSLEAGRVGTRLVSDHQTLVHFDLAALPDGAAITAARLRLYQHAAEGAADGLAIRPDAITGRWVERDVTWETRPPAANLGDPPLYALLANGWREWSVTGIVEHWAANRDQNYGILLHGDGTTLGLRTFYAREYGEAPPELIIDYTTTSVTDTPTATRTPTPTPTSTRTPTSTPTSTRTPTPTATAHSCTEVQIIAGADAWADQSQPSANHGADTSLIAGKTAQTPSNRVALVHFNLNTLPAGAWIHYAWLELYQTGATGPAQYGVWVEALTAKWGEAAVTWATLPAVVDVGVPPLAVPATTGAWRRWDATIPAQGWAAGDGVNAGMLLRGDGTTVGARTFGSRESANPPRLVMCYALDTTPPTNPNSFTADHTIDQWSSEPWISGHWNGASDGAGSGVHGYSIEWSQSPDTVPDAVLDTTTNQTTQYLDDGHWRLHVRTRDVAGNWNAGASHFGPYKIDASPPVNPTISSTTHTAGAWSTKTSVTVSWSGASDGAGSGLAGYSILWDGAAATSPDTVADTTGTTATATRPEGSTYFHLRARDVAGNWSAPVHFGPVLVDTLAPATEINAPVQVTSKTFNVSWSGSDAGSGIKHYEVRYRDLTASNQTWQTLYAATTLTSRSFTGLDGHKYMFQARAYDQLGNVRDWSAVPTATTSIATVDFSSLGLEVTQGIQDMNNSVRLVQNRRTFARFHVKSAAGDHWPVAAELSLYRNGQLIETIPPNNPDGAITVLQNPDRGQLGQSFYFDLPSWWLHGAITLEARIRPAEWAQSNTNNDTASATVSFENVPPLDVTLVDVGYNLNGTLYTVPPADVLAQASWLRRIYPVPSINLVYGWACCFTAELDSKGNMTYPGCGDVNSDLAWHKANNAFGTASLKWSRTYGMVSDAGRFMRGCAAGIPATVASGPSWPGGEWYGSHELGHALDQEHTRGDNPAPCGTCSKAECGPWSMCGCEGGATDYGRNGDISLTKQPYAGTTFYGFDIETLAIYPPTMKENMTYCNPEWISDYTYESIMDRIQWEGAHQVAARASPRGEYLAVFGSVITATQQVSLDAFYRLPDTIDLIGREPGPYSIRLLGEGDVQLVDYPFTPRWSHEDPGPTCAASVAAAENPAQITEYVPWVEGTRRIAIFYGDQELAARPVSGHAPAVTLTTPNGGGALTGETVTVAWSAADEDGDTLTFSVEYSIDGGASWRMLRTGLTATQTVLPLARLGGTAQGKFRVLATDGVNTSRDASDGVFSVPHKAPVVQLTAPVDGARYIPGQSIALIGGAMDVEDGALAGDALQWSSDLSGALGAGEMLHVTDLPAGLHTITLTAQDSSGLHATATATILVADLDEMVYLPLVLR